MSEREKEMVARITTAVSRLDEEKQKNALFFIEGMAAVREDEQVEETSAAVPNHY